MKYACMKIFGKILVNKQFLVPIDYCFILWKSMGNSNYLVTNILLLC